MIPEPDAAAAATAQHLDGVLRDLDALILRLAESVLAAGSLAAGTDWQAAAARAFHDGAEAWARDVYALEVAAEAVRDETRRARDSAALAAGWW